MFRRIETGSDSERTFTIEFCGSPVEAMQGESVASALLRAGITNFRETPGSRVKRGPFCLMGACFDCLVVIDGVGNQQACTTMVRAGMIVERQLSSGVISGELPDPWHGTQS